MTDLGAHIAIIMAAVFLVIYHVSRIGFAILSDLAHRQWADRARRRKLRNTVCSEPYGSSRVVSLTIIPQGLSDAPAPARFTLRAPGYCTGYAALREVEHRLGVPVERICAKNVCEMGISLQMSLASIAKTYGTTMYVSRRDRCGMRRLERFQPPPGVTVPHCTAHTEVPYDLRATRRGECLWWSCPEQGCTKGRRAEYSVYEAVMGPSPAEPLRRNRGRSRTPTRLDPSQANVGSPVQRASKRRRDTEPRSTRAKAELSEAPVELTADSTPGALLSSQESLCRRMASASIDQQAPSPGAGHPAPSTHPARDPHEANVMQDSTQGALFSSQESLCRRMEGASIDQHAPSPGVGHPAPSTHPARDSHAATAPTDPTGGSLSRIVPELAYQIDQAAGGPLRSSRMTPSEIVTEGPPSAPERATEPDLPHARPFDAERGQRWRTRLLELKLPRLRPHANTAATDPWAALDELDLMFLFQTPVPTFQNVPRWAARWYRECARLAFERLQEEYALAPADSHPPDQELTRAWKLVLLLPRLLLARCKEEGQVGRAKIEARFEMFRQGKWVELVANNMAAQSHANRGTRDQQRDSPAEAKLDQCIGRCRLGELSHARAALMGATLAPFTEATYASLTDETRRPSKLLQAVSQSVRDFIPDAEIELDTKLYLDNVRRARRGKAPGPSGLRNEHQRALLDDVDLQYLQASIASQLARGRIPEPVREAMALGRLTAFNKKDGGLRGITSGDVMRRTVARTLAQQHAAAFMSITAPHQYALSTRAGVDVVALLVRSLTDADPDLTVASLDGIGAYDHVRRAAFLQKMVDEESVRPLLPFVKLWYGTGGSTYLWNGQIIHQGEGIEQGDPLAPALFALAMVDPLNEAAELLGPGEYLFAFLDDVYCLAQPSRIATVAKDVANIIEKRAGIEPKLGKFGMWNKRGGSAPPGIDKFGEPPLGSDPIWKGDLPPSKNGIKILGSPIGTEEFVRGVLAAVLEAELAFLELLPHVAGHGPYGLQAAWLLLLFCAEPRANHLLRTIPPRLLQAPHGTAEHHAAPSTTESAELAGGTSSASSLAGDEPRGQASDNSIVGYAAAHDQLLWNTLRTLLAIPPATDDRKARVLASLPLGRGGLGLRMATLISPAAYWAGWADSMPTISARLPILARKLTAQLGSEIDLADPPHRDRTCVDDAVEASAVLHADGWEDKPDWIDLEAGLTAPTPAATAETIGQWAHGWQYYASQARWEAYVNAHVVPRLSPQERAKLLSNAGVEAAAWARALPTSPETTRHCEHFQIFLRRRLFLPLPVDMGSCEANGCSATLDDRGDHYAACPKTGRLKTRGTRLEEAWARVIAESGVRFRGGVQNQPRLGELVAGIDAQDERRVEFIIYGTELSAGLPMVLDVCMVSPLHADGCPRPGTSRHPGIAMEEAVKGKRRWYHELEDSPNYKFHVAACETGGRWNEGAQQLVSTLIRHKTQQVPRLLRRAAALGYQRRWWSILSVAAQTALADTLMPSYVYMPNNRVSHEAPLLSEVLALASDPPVPSRLPL